MTRVAGQPEYVGVTRDDPCVAVARARRARCRARRSTRPGSPGSTTPPSARQIAASARVGVRRQRRRRSAARSLRVTTRVRDTSAAATASRRADGQMLGVDALLAAARAAPCIERSAGHASVASSSTARDRRLPRRVQRARRRRRCRRRSARARSRRRRTSRRCTSTARRSPPASARATRRCRRPGGHPVGRALDVIRALPSPPSRRCRRCARRVESASCRSSSTCHWSNRNWRAIVSA